MSTSGPALSLPCNERAPPTWGLSNETKPRQGTEMPDQHIPESKHFTLERLANGVYACIHKPGGGAYSNAGIVDLGGSTLLVDALNTLAAAHDLRQAAEGLFDRPVETLVLTHAHNDHWMGASALEAGTAFWATEAARQVCIEWGARIVEDFRDRTQWEEWRAETEGRLQTEQDERVRAGLLNSLSFIDYILAEMAGYRPRYADRIFEHAVTFRGTQRAAELRSLGRGHSEDDSVLLLSQDGIAFIGDVGFFDTQPFLGFCDIDLYREQMLFFRDSAFHVLVPGHGPVGGRADIGLQLDYLDVMEELVGDVARRGGSWEEATRIVLPKPFDDWLMGGMDRFLANVRYLFARFGGEVPEQ